MAGRKQPGRALQLTSATPTGSELQFQTLAFGRAEEVEKIYNGVNQTYVMLERYGIFLSDPLVGSCEIGDFITDIKF